MDVTQQILSDITVHMKYARFKKELNRRETWDELVTRNKNMHIKKYPELADDILNAYEYVHAKEVLPSMRSMQFAGKPIEIVPSRIYNCAFLPVDDWRAFSEIMFLLLGGTGVGYSVQNHHVMELPEIRKPRIDRGRRYLVGDSIEGWSDAIKVLMRSYFTGGSTIRFDYSDIRPKGAELVTSGGKAPGPRPLQECIIKIVGILSEKNDGDFLRPIEVHDIICHIADAVLAGGIRRAALISLFSATDDEMLSAKIGNWDELNPQRGRANNSVVLLRHRISEEVFFDLWGRIEASGAGEPGIFFTNDKDWGTNPCCEIALRPFSFCNLVEINSSTIVSQEDLNARAKAASFIATLQASYTDFHYLRPIWQRTTEKDALVGVSLTGIASNRVQDYDLKEAVKIIKAENIWLANKLKINKAARYTCIKPAGTTSLVLGCSSGIHAWHNDYYIRRIRVGKTEAIYSYLLNNHSELVEDEYFRPHSMAVIGVPQRAPEGAILRHESPLQLLDRVKDFSERWVRPGHDNGSNSHNISVTVNIRDNEWHAVGIWMWENRKIYNGISVLPFSGTNYKQLPFEDCTEEEFERLYQKLREVNLEAVVEYTDGTNLTGELACTSGACEIV